MRLFTTTELRTEKEKSDQKKKPGCYLASVLFSIPTILFFELLFPGVIPFGPFELWVPKHGVGNWLLSAIPLFITGLIVAIFSCFWRYYIEEKSPDDPVDQLTFGIPISIWAGVVEEICFRWLIFYAAIVSAKFTNICFFGLTRIFHIHIEGPIVNFFTLGYLNDYLGNPEKWAVGIAIVTTAALFRDGHKYQGLVGYIISWFGGMALFWFALNYGLLAAILIHFLYDLIFDITGFIFFSIVEWNEAR